MNGISAAYWMTPLLFLPLAAVWRLATRTSHPGLLMVALQFSFMAAFEILVDGTYVLLTQENLTDNPVIGEFLFESFFATLLQHSCFALTLLALFSRGFIATRGVLRFGAREDRFVSFLVIVAGILSIYTIITQGEFSFIYGNGQEEEGSLEGEAGSWGPIAGFVQLGTIFSWYCILKGLRKDNLWRIAYAFSIFLIVLFALKLLTGARAAVFTLAMYAIGMALLLQVRAKTIVVASGVACIVLIVLFSTFSSVRTAGEQLSFGEAVEQLTTGIGEQLIETSTFQRLQLSVQDFAWRSAGARMGAVLFADVEDRGTVGVTAVVNNIFSGVPRALWTNRPYGNSRDGSAEGLATYQVSQILTGVQGGTFQSDSVSTASVAYWTMGWIGVILSGCVSALVIWYVASIARRSGSGLPWLILCGLVSGGWYILVDIGSWLGLASKFGPILAAAYYVATRNVVARDSASRQPATSSRDKL